MAQFGSDLQAPRFGQAWQRDFSAPGVSSPMPAAMDPFSALAGGMMAKEEKDRDFGLKEKTQDDRVAYQNELLELKRELETAKIEIARLKAESQTDPAKVEAISGAKAKGAAKYRPAKSGRGGGSTSNPWAGF